MAVPKLLREYLVPFLDFCEVQKGLADNSQRNYRQYLRVFFEWLKKHGHERLTPEELNTEHLWDYRLYLARRHRTPTGGYLIKHSQNQYLIALRAFLEFLAERDIDTVASSKIKLAKHKPEETTSFLDPREIEAMVELPHVGKAERDEGKRPGASTDERERIKALERENRTLRQANEILRKASVQRNRNSPMKSPFADFPDSKSSR